MSIFSGETFVTIVNSFYCKKIQKSPYIKQSNVILLNATFQCNPHVLIITVVCFNKQISALLPEILIFHPIFEKLWPRFFRNFRKWRIGKIIIFSHDDVKHSCTPLAYTVKEPREMRGWTKTRDIRPQWYRPTEPHMSPAANRCI